MQELILNHKILKIPINPGIIRKARKRPLRKSLEIIDMKMKILEFNISIWIKNLLKKIL
jgi:hypothetical protein